MGLLNFLRGLFGRFRKPKRERIIFTEDALLLVWPQRGEEGLSWDSIQEIALRTTRTSATVDRLHLYLLAGPQRLVVPQSAENFEALIDFIRQLPGCKKDALDHAVAAQGEGWFPVWRRPSARSAVAG